MKKKRKPSSKALSHRQKAHLTKQRKASASSIRKIEKRIGQRNLAKILGVAPRSIRRYKQGTRVPRFDIANKLKRIEKVSRGQRKTKSVKKKRQRAERLVERHPEVQYFEQRPKFKYADTEHFILRDVQESDIPDLIQYLIDQGCEAAFFVLEGIDQNGEVVHYQTEVTYIYHFAESWEDLLSELKIHVTSSKYGFRAVGSFLSLDLCGIKSYAPSVIKGSEK